MGREGPPGTRVGQRMSPAHSHQLAEQYGPVFTVHLGHQKTVVLTGYEAVKKALVGAGQELAGRPPIAIFQLINGGGGRCVWGAGHGRGRGMVSAPMRPRGSTRVPAWQAQSNGGGAHQDWARHTSWRGRWGLGGPEAPSGSCPGAAHHPACAARRRLLLLRSTLAGRPPAHRARPPWPGRGEGARG